jgi:hypothetical protein
MVDVLEGAAEGSELPARLLGDEHLPQAVPVDRLAGLDRHVGHLLRAVPAHLRRRALSTGLSAFVLSLAAALRPRSGMGQNETVLYGEWPVQWCVRARVIWWVQVGRKELLLALDWALCQIFGLGRMLRLRQSFALNQN